MSLGWRAAALRFLARIRFALLLVYQHNREDRILLVYWRMAQLYGNRLLDPGNRRGSTDLCMSPSNIRGRFAQLDSRIQELSTKPVAGAPTLRSAYLWLPTVVAELGGANLVN